MHEGVPVFGGTLTRQLEGQQPQEVLVQVATLLAQHPAQLRRHGQPAGGGERLGDLLVGELAAGPAVDPLGVAPGGVGDLGSGPTHRCRQTLADQRQQGGSIALTPVRDGSQVASGSAIGYATKYLP